MVAGCSTNDRLIERVAEIYNRLDLQISQSAHLAGQCRGCGKCCDFAGFDHRLFITTPELMYLAGKLGNENIRPMATGRCPYNAAGKCTIHKYRFAGCRIFCCRGNADFQSGLTESALKGLKSICTEFGIPYRYTELAGALNGFVGA
ncbi:MAG TPA: hypothetical protein VMW16_15125 [Sedimentisphaerales bacterium]|nr:hypothetical protein [Sedimentisphaerales bacterium]